ncbi:M56 family metallopeptidase [Siminovitchia terrae]|uniref:M56 family metallopeptidase n=1 Tax=Siminovitchia terrae TaxID=1914933 RepID=UPI0028B1C6A2|nr:M56 family metallopeptidase [Siminovitchia terrae]
MNEWLRILVSLTVAGSVVLLLSFLITYVTKESLSAKWSYWSRKMSLFFFLVPIFFTTEFLSIFRKENPDISFGSQSVIHQNTLSLPLTFVQVLFAVWITGVIVTSVWAFFSYQRFMKKMKASCFILSEESEVRKLFNKNVNRMNLSTAIEIAYCNCNMSPVFIGIFKPIIVLPIYKIPNDELDMIIKHELIHFKKKDLWIRRAVLIASIVHWYNPFVYLLQKEVHLWSELSCDEDVVMEMSQTERKKYGETILNMIERANLHPDSYFLGVFFSTEQLNLKRRLIKMLHVKKMSKSVMALSTFALLGLGSIGVGGAVLAQQNTPSVSEEDKVAELVPAKENKTEVGSIEVGGPTETLSVSEESDVPKLVIISQH